MNEGRIKGKIFEYTLEYVARRWGQNGLDTVSMVPGKYLPERWYPLSDFCYFLSDICTNLSHGDTSNISRIAHEIVRNDEGGRILFKGKDPAEVFMSTKHQDEQYDVGKFDVEAVEAGHISIHMTPLIEDEHCVELWCEFYQGYIKGILFLTDHLGEVDKTLHLEKAPKSCTYDIKWR